MRLRWQDYLVLKENAKVADNASGMLFWIFFGKRFNALAEADLSLWADVQEPFFVDDTQLKTKLENIKRPTALPVLSL